MEIDGPVADAAKVQALVAFDATSFVLVTHVGDSVVAVNEDILVAVISILLHPGGAILDDHVDLSVGDVSGRISTLPLGRPRLQTREEACWSHAARVGHAKRLAVARNAHEDLVRRHARLCNR